MKQWTKTFSTFCCLAKLDQREQVRNVGMHAAVAEQADEVQLALGGRVPSPAETAEPSKLLVGDQQFDARDVHVHDAAGADVQMADFAVAHLSFGQADVRA